MKTFFARVRRASLTFPFAFLAALGLLLISEYSYNRSMSAMDSLERVVTMRLTVQSLLRDLLDAETSQRGYLLTGNESYLEPYRAALTDIDRLLGETNHYYVTRSEEAGRYGALTAAVAQKLSEMTLTLELRRQGRDDAWRSIVETSIGLEQMSVVRNIVAQLVKDQTVRIAAEDALVQQTLMLSRVGIGATAVLSLLATALYLRQSQALARERGLREEALQAERDSLERQVRDRTRGLAELANHLQSVREDERARLARELHDELGALLTTAKLDVARIKSRLKDQSPEASERIAHLNEALNSVIALKRRIIEDLRPSSLSNLGLVAALEILTREVGERSDIRVQGVFEPARLSASGELTVYRLVQEALTNAVKYARAAEVRVELRALPQHVEISVRDDGIGFDPQASHPSAHGLLGMRYRVEGEGGRMEVDSHPGAGTQILALLPVVAGTPSAAGAGADGSAETAAPAPASPGDAGIAARPAAAVATVALPPKQVA